MEKYTLTSKDKVISPLENVYLVGYFYGLFEGEDMNCGASAIIHLNKDHFF